MTFPKSSFASAATGLLLLASSAACAQTQSLPSPVASTRVPASDVEMGGPALWKLADEDTTIYLFGTVHVLPKDQPWFTPAIDTALDSSDELVTEVLMTPEIGAKTQAIVMQKGMLPEGSSVRDLMNEQQKATYETAMTRLGLPVAAFDRFEPWFGALNLSILPLMKEGYSPEDGVEKVLEKETDREIKRAALETIEFQLSIFDELPQQAQVDYLVQAAEMIDELKPYIDRMVAEWIEGNADALAEIMNEGVAENPVLMERLMHERNANWAVWIDDRMDEPGTVFIAVGAGHLAGQKSVQELLTERGFTITRVQ
ncbi:TraB/GumN family protein [Erythrobacter litoralis]|uniref:TraB/GumN family protein n=1 Tax=Erythrobacter litoralis (strain HTCC2594) TaxID=314225 RepID=Q2NAM9_ERYLH|nr:TraB/GumN family protein [Erythrobacter litoralis]ABC63262.1 hypothetical protein ELI_05850 [Erythrobacter litoralis HTCC2594]